jgi:hypothetical protein
LQFKTDKCRNAPSAVSKETGEDDAYIPIYTCFTYMFAIYGERDERERQRDRERNTKSPRRENC